MTLSKIFPLWLHAIAAATSVGWAAGLHHTPGTPVLTTYTVTGFAVGMVVTTIIRAIATAVKA